MEGAGRFPELEKRPRTFNWRDYLQHPEHMPENEAAMLDTLAGMLQKDPEADEFFSSLRKGEYKSHTALAFVNFFRDALVQDERSKLSEAIKACGPSGPLENGRDTGTS